jgi:CRP-like cAMP-binding protein
MILITTKCDFGNRQEIAPTIASSQCAMPSYMAICPTTKAKPDPLTQQLFSRRDTIPPRTDVLWRIERGAVRTLTWSEEGTLITLGYWGPGDVVGHPLSRLKVYEIECLTSVEVRILPSVLWCQALDAIVLHIQQAEELLSIVHRNPVRQRLWQFLVWLGEKFGRDVDAVRLIDLEVTHQEMADVVNTTRVTVTRLLQQFEESGMLRRHKRQLVLCWRGAGGN